MPEEEGNTSVRGKTAVVTGAARRIGRAVSLALGKAGVNVVIHDHQSLQGECRGLCEEIGAFGVNTWIVTADFEVPADYESFMSRALGEAGRIDILVNNASIFLPDTLVGAELRSLVRHITINAWAPLILSREFARLCKRGHIINMLDSKIASHDWDHFSYIMSKHMLRLITDLAALEFAPHISVNSVAPGLILPPLGKDEKYLQDLSATLPLKRYGGANDVSDAVLFLLGSGFITGQTIYLDGGRHLGSR